MVVFSVCWLLEPVFPIGAGTWGGAAKNPERASMCKNGVAEPAGERLRVEVPDAAYWTKQIKCHDACPVNTDARGYVRAIAQGNFEAAYLIARGPNPLASICGRVCGAPCEAACRRGSVDQAVSIRALKRFVTNLYGPETRSQRPLDILQRVLHFGRQRQVRGKEELTSLRRLLRRIDPPKLDGHKVAIVGAGPAGLAAAHDLALMGFRPTVFEMEPIPAGMLVLGIPSYRLPRDLVTAEVELIEALGVHFECNVQVGGDLSLAQLRNEFAATIIAVGAKYSRRLSIPGSKGEGVLGGVEFLRSVALSEPAELGQRIVVIGGGNVAYDVARSVVRQVDIDVARSALRHPSVREVNMVSLESLEEMPADDVEIIEGDEEGIVRHHRMGPKEILLDEAGKVQSVLFQEVLRVFDENGRFSPIFGDGLTTIEADTVLWAIGQQPDLSFIPAGGDIRFTERGLIDVDPVRLTTSAEDVFLAGDIATGPGLLIHAVATGKRAARSVHRYLTGLEIKPEQVMIHVPILGYEREADYEKQGRVPVPALDPDKRKASHTAVVELGYEPADAMREAGRCFDCGVNTVFDSDVCILCGGCADVCPELCLRLVPVEALEATEQIQELLEARYAPEELPQGSAIIKDESRCIRCALCAERCPVNAITMERVHYESPWREVGS